MSEAVFISKAESYNGHYVINRHSTGHEYTPELHYHDFYEIQFYLSEEEDGIIGDITINGNKRTLIQGCLVLINMFDQHQIHITTKAPYTRFCISFDSSLLLFASSDKSNMFNIFSICSEPRFSKPLTPPQIKSLMDIYEKYTSTHIEHGQDIMDMSIILDLFAHIYNIFYDGNEISAADSRSMEVVTKLIGYIDEHLAEDLSLEVLADYVSFSIYHLSRIFKKYTGTTLNRYIITKRIDKARLMLGGDMPITNISQEVGFNNYNHFYRTFKTMTGLSPADYREELIQKREKA